MRDFAVIRAQAIELLQREGRVAYRVLQLQLQVDNALLEVLKDDLIYAKRLAVDDEGKVLVWVGAPPAAPPDTRPPAEAERQFHTVLLAVMALLQREQRVTYRTLQYVFGVDQACLRAVRDELRFRRLAREEGGQGLVWIGEVLQPAATAAVPRPTPDTAMALPVISPRPPLPPHEGSRPLHEPTPVLDEVSSLPVDDVGPPTSDDVSVIPSVVARSAPDAERRQLTVLFCDLVGSTQLSGQLDPEDLRTVVRAYQEAAATVIACYEGHIAQYLGDGLLVYFGYPTAHEDDARRAVHTGLGIVQAIATLNTRLEAQYGVHLAVRLGIHTGPVVVGVMGGGGRHERQVLVAWEDLHWADPTTLELLGLVIEQAPTVPMLHVLTSRPEFSPPWPRRSHITPLVLTHLERPQVEALITQRARGKTLPAEVVQHIVAKTDGVPLYVEELTKMLLSSPLLREEAEQYVLTGPLHTVAIPDTLQDALMARLDQLQTAKEVAQLGAVLGREFPYDLLQAIAPEDKNTLQEGLAQLVEAEILYQRGRPPRARYIFKHALIQDAAYASLLKSTRQHVHQQIAQVLEARFPAIVETQPELVAQHYTAANCPEQAVVYWQRAGQFASERSAHLEAISHVTTGIELLTTLPETPAHTQQALTLHIALGGALQLAKGMAAPEVEHAYTRARELCQQIGETPEIIPVLYGLWRFYVVRSQCHTAHELGETLLRLAQQAHDPALSVIAHYALGVTWLFLGVLPAARQHLEAGIARYTPDQRRAPVFRIGHDPGVACRVHAAQTLWLLGYPEQALVRLHEALALAHELSHPPSLAFAQCLAALVSQWRRDVSAVHEHAEAAVALATAQGFPQWAAWGTSLRGWALAMQGYGETGLSQLRQGIAPCQATGTALYVPYCGTMLAEVCNHLGHPDEGLQALVEAHTLMKQQEERLWEAETCRLWGVLLLWQPGTPPAEAETWLQRALDVARRRRRKHWGCAPL